MTGEISTPVAESIRGRSLVIAIDGPAGAGKSTLARLLAQSLDYTYIDTGAMYRTVGLLAHERGIPLDDCAALAELAEGLCFEFRWIDGTLHTLADGRDVSGPIRTPEAAMNASTVSKVGEVRAALVALQRVMGEAGGIVMEGRDIGTVVFPDAELKVFLSASSRVRGERRWREMKARGQEAELDAVIVEVQQRDLQDSTREIAPLRPAADAVVLDCSQMDIEQVLGTLVRLVESRQTSPR